MPAGAGPSWYIPWGLRERVQRTQGRFTFVAYLRSEVRKTTTKAESDRAKRAHGGVKNEKFAEIVLIYAGSERSELASDSAI